MKKYNLPRLHINHPLKTNNNIILLEHQAHYLHNVLRHKIGDNVLLFNNVDGEFLGNIKHITKKEVIVETIKQTRKQHTNNIDLHLIFAPIKNCKAELITRYSTELGVSAITPVITQRTIAKNVNYQRMESVAIEAAEQCERLSVPKIYQAAKLQDIINKWDKDRQLILCAEHGNSTPIHKAICNIEGQRKYTIMTGPEGGFSDDEMTMIRDLPNVIAVGLGENILRADTAIIAAISSFQAIIGNWDKAPIVRDSL